MTRVEAHSRVFGNRTSRNNRLISAYDNQYSKSTHRDRKCVVCFEPLPIVWPAKYCHICIEMYKTHSFCKQFEGHM